MQGLKRLASYIKGTPELGLRYPKSDTSGMVLYTDADFATTDLDDRRSMTGYILFWNGAPLSYGSGLQRSVSLSTMEAETWALSQGIQQAHAMLQCIDELHHHLQLASARTPVPVHVDNQAAIIAATSVTGTTRAKHIMIRTAFVRQHIRNGTFALHYCPSAQNIADFFTKALPRPQFQLLRSRIMA